MDLDQATQTIPLSTPDPAIASDGSISPDASPLPFTSAPPPFTLEVSALTDTGCTRPNNEDCFGYSDLHGIYVVCDGMGGMASGEVASASAVSTILETFTLSAGSGVPVSTRLLHAIDQANRAVWRDSQTPEHRGMGTTVVAAALDGNKLVIGNVGDSRAYMIHAGHCTQLTLDHSYVNELIRNGSLTPEDAYKADLNGMDSVITRAIGATPEVKPDFFSVELEPDTSLLLATDGLTRYLLQDEIALAITNSLFEAACSNLIQIAKQRGGQDNITCLLLRASAR